MAITAARRITSKFAAVMLAVAALWSVPAIGAMERVRPHIKREVAWLKNALKVPTGNHQKRSSSASRQRA